jgi:hypothetical protein
MNKLFLISLMSLMLFLGASINKILNFTEVVNDFIDTTTPFLKLILNNRPPLVIYKIIIICVILLQFIASSIVLLASYKNLQNKGLNMMSRISLYILIIFSILATLIYHIRFEKRHIIMTLSNLSVIAGLWLLSEKF